MFTLVTLFIVGICQCASAPSDSNIEHTHSVPVDIYSTADYIVLVSPFKNDVCCGDELTFENGIQKLELKKCSKFVTCKKSPSFRKEIIESDCKEGYQTSFGCVKTSPNNFDANQTYTAKCICTEKGIQCPDKLHVQACDGENAIITHEDEVIYLSGEKKELNNVKIRTMFIPTIKVDPETNVIFSKAYCKANKIYFELQNAKNVECTADISGRTCRFICKEQNCNHACALEGDESDTKIKSRIVCGNEDRSFWLFRSKKNMLPQLAGHGAWRSHSKTISTLLIIDICIGYIIIRLSIGLLYYGYNIACVLLNVFNTYFNKYILGRALSMYDSCPICKNTPINIFDVYLHDKYCFVNACPYCKIELDEEFQHVKECDQKDKAIASIKEEMKDEMFAMVKEVNKRMKVEIWRNKLTKNKLPSKVWIFSMIFLGVMLLIAPSSALLKKPCSKQVGHTAKCSSKNDFDSLGGETEEHAYWSTAELGMLNEMEHKFEHDVFAANSIHRLKVDKLHLKGDSEQSLEIAGKKCKSNGVCQAVTEIKWSGDVSKGNLEMFATNEDESHKSTLNIFIADAEIIYPLLLEYRTAAWSLDVRSKFACTETDCKKVCTGDSSKNKCIIRTESKSKETSWSHNPAWCWSINSGCTCVEVEVHIEPDSSVYEVYKLGTPTMRALLCIEQNSMFIQCVEVDKVGTFDMTKTKIQITKWSVGYSMNKKIIVERGPGSNSSKAFAKTGPVCERENCNMGDAGDFQFNRMSHICNESFYINTAGLEVRLDYDFARTPTWDVNAPKAGAHRFQKYRSLTDSARNHIVNLKEGELILSDDTLGTFALIASVNNLEIYEVMDEGRIKDFSTKNCIGQYMSSIGVICVFKIELENAERATIEIISDDDTSFIQGDRQTIVAGTNTFRKFMYVRSKQPTYKFCAVHKKEKICNSFKYNLTDPNYNWTTTPYNMHIGNVEEFSSQCDYWFGLSCFFSRIADFFKTCWSSIIWILLAILSVVLIKFIWSVLMIKWDKSDPYHVEMDKSNFLEKSLAKISKKKVRVI
uniref:Glycoprotein n=1 Tax=Macrotermes bellicosus bunya-like virus 1 TaxID=3133463 RepID=A0AAT9J9U6_9VIRU